MASSTCAESFKPNGSASKQLLQIVQESTLSWVNPESVRFTNNFLSLRNASVPQAAAVDEWAGSVIYIEFNDDDEEGNGSDNDWAGQADCYWQRAVLRKQLGPRAFRIEYVDDEGEEGEETNDGASNEEAHEDDNIDDADEDPESFATVEFSSQPFGTLRVVGEGAETSSTVHVWRGCSSLADYLNDAPAKPSCLRTIDGSNSPTSAPSLELFEGALSVEDQAYQNGIQDGKQKTYNEKFAEGSEFGTRHGFADAFEVGCQAGFSDVVSRLILPRVTKALGERVAPKVRPLLCVSVAHILYSFMR